MHALVCRNPGDLALEERPLPVRGPSEVLVKPRRVGICGTDYHIYEGNQPFLAYPRVMGHELAVEIVDAPPGSMFADGDAAIVNPYLSCGVCIACRNGKPNCCVEIAVMGVHIDGGMAQYLSLPSANLIPADGLTLDQCATVEFLAIGAHAVRRSGIRPGQRVLVTGAGPIGIGVVLFAALAGARITAMDRDAGRLAALGDIIGIGDTILAGTATTEDVMAATHGEGFDAVFDATGSVASIEAGFAHVAHGGSYTLVSIVKDIVSFVDADFHRREMTLFASRNALAADFEAVTAAMRAGNVPTDKLITHRTTLAGATTDLPRWATDKHGLIKALIEL